MDSQTSTSLPPGQLFTIFQLTEGFPPSYNTPVKVGCDFNASSARNPGKNVSVTSGSVIVYVGGQDDELDEGPNRLLFTPQGDGQVLVFVDPFIHRYFSGIIPVQRERLL